MRGKICGGADTRRDAANEGMDVDNRFAALDGIGIGVALGDLAGVALDGALDLELIAELAVDSEFERAVDRENRVDVSDGAVDDVRGGIFFCNEMLVSKRVKFYTVKGIQCLFMHNIQCQSEDTHCGDNHLKTKLEQVTID